MQTIVLMAESEELLNTVVLERGKMGLSLNVKRKRNAWSSQRNPQTPNAIWSEKEHDLHLDNGQRVYFTEARNAQSTTAEPPGNNSDILFQTLSGICFCK